MNGYKTIGTLDISLLSLVEKEFKLSCLSDIGPITINFSSPRLHCFKESRICYICGREGTKLLIQYQKLISDAHACMYSDNDILMTKDHVIPYSKSKNDTQENLKTCCFVCNVLKDCKDIPVETIKFATETFNKEYLSSRDFRKSIRIAKKSMKDK